MLEFPAKIEEKHLKDYLCMLRKRARGQLAEEAVGMVKWRHKIHCGDPCKDQPNGRKKC